MLDSSRLRSAVDIDKVNEFKKEMGYYQIVTSELDRTDTDIIDIYHGLSRIEDQFRVLKGDLSTRPVFVNTEEHIDAHLAICTIALTVMRIIQNKVANYLGAESGNNGWSYAISADRVRTALNSWTVESIADDYYRFNNADLPDLKLILDAFGINIPQKLFRKQSLRSLKSSFGFSTQYI